MELVVMQAIELVLVLGAMIFVLMGREIHPVPKTLGTVAGVLFTICLASLGVPMGASMAGGLMLASLLGEIGDHFLDRY